MLTSPVESSVTPIASTDGVRQPIDMTRDEFADYVDSLSYGDPYWKAVIKWNNEQVDLIRLGERKPPNVGTKLVDAYYDEVVKITPLVTEPVVPVVITEEDYLASKGAGFMGGAEPGIHKNIQYGRGRQQNIAKVQADMAANNARREVLREEYQAKVKSGEIRSPIRTEGLIGTARGNPDNQSVQAARRLLEKQGVAWEQITPLVTDGVSDEEFLIGRLQEGTVSAYSTTHFTESQNKLLKKWVRQGKVIKVEMPVYSGEGNRYIYLATETATPQPTQVAPIKAIDIGDNYAVRDNKDVVASLKKPADFKDLQSYGEYMVSLGYKATYTKRTGKTIWEKASLTQAEVAAPVSEGVRAEVIPEKLQPAIEAVKEYPSAKAFIADVNKSVKQFEDLFSITGQTKRHMATGSSELGRPLTTEEKRLQKVYDIFFRVLKPDTQNYTDFYNRIVKYLHSNLN